MNEELKVIISAEVAKLKKGIDDAKKQVSGFKEQVKNAAAGVDDSFSKMGSTLNAGMKAAAVGVAAAATALVALGGSTAEYREEQAKLKSAFEASGGSAEEAKETYNDLYRVLGDSGQATEAASHLAKLTTEEKALSEWTNICQGVYATFGDSLPIESLTEAANETAKTGELTGGLADALNWAGVSEDAFSESLAACNTEAEREALIRETLSGLYNDAATTYEENNAQVLAQRDAQAQLQETLAQLGETVAPVITAFTSLANDALAVVVPYIQQIAETYGPQLKAALEGVAEAVKTTMTFLTENWQIVLAVAGVIAGIAAAIGLYNAVAAVKAAMDAAQVTTLGALIAAYAAQAAAMVVAIAPYLLIVAAIAAVIAIIVVCVKHWDTIKAKVAEVWSNIKSKTSEAVENVKQKFNEMKAKASEKIASMKADAVNKFNEIKSGITEKIQTAKTSVLNIFDNIKNGIRDKINGAKDTVSAAVEKIKGFFKFTWNLPKLKTPKISVSWDTSGVLAKAAQFIGLAGIPRFAINWNALGGVFDKPTVFGYGNSLQGIGENGAEAVVPLEKNTEWLDKIADKLAARQALTPIVIKVGEKTFGEVACSSINALTRETGNLPINLY